MGTLAVVVRFADQRDLIEVFVGRGEEDGKAIRDAFAAYVHGAMHVMLRAIWQFAVPSQPENERWHINGHDYEVFLGPWQERGEGMFCATLDDAIRATIEGLSLTEDLHWIRFFVASSDGDDTFEALKDSDSWPHGVEMLKAQDWNDPESYGSVRGFMMLRKCA